MAHLQAFRAAVDGKLRGNKPGPTAAIIVNARRLIFAAVAFLFVALAGTAGYAESGAFAGMAGNWSGGGTITLDDGSTERIRCRATYAVRADGNGHQPDPDLRQRQLQIQPRNRCYRPGHSAFRDLERKHSQRQRQP